ncbi:MAG TPA: hypothetical protein PLU88_00745 [Armatimonadota bacterium]|nr:hypothetical protein [Armatimonadota bacterium]
MRFLAVAMHKTLKQVQCDAHPVMLDPTCHAEPAMFCRTRTVMPK